MATPVMTVADLRNQSQSQAPVQQRTQLEPVESLNPFATATQNRMQRTSGYGAVANTDSQRAVAEVQAAMMIARMNPRDQIVAMDRILNACTRPTLAEVAVYQYSRGGTDISGPSIRLAETLAQCWGNIQFGVREIEQRDAESTVQAFAWDVETNTRREMTFTVPHIRFTKHGSKLLEDPRDVYEMIANQGARRVRACILSIIPGDVTEAAVKQCEQTLRSKADTSPAGLQKILDLFADFGVTKGMIEKRIQRRFDAIQQAQVVALRKIYVSLKDGMSKVSDWFEIESGVYANVLNMQEKAASQHPVQESVRQEITTPAPVKSAVVVPQAPQQEQMQSAPQSVQIAISMQSATPVPTNSPLPQSSPMQQVVDQRTPESQPRTLAQPVQEQPAYTIAGQTGLVHEEIPLTQQAAKKPVPPPQQQSSVSDYQRIRIIDGKQRWVDAYGGMFDPKLHEWNAQRDEPLVDAHRRLVCKSTQESKQTAQTTQQTQPTVDARWPEKIVDPETNEETFVDSAGTLFDGHKHGWNSGRQCPSVTPTGVFRAKRFGYAAKKPGDAGGDEAE